MAIGPVLRGAVVSLRPVERSDAARVIEIRNAPGAEVGLPPIPDDIPRQEAWIDEQRERAGDYFFGMHALDSERLDGTIGLTREPTIAGEWSAGDAWEWGRWASSSADPRLAVEGASLLLGFALDHGVSAVWIRLLPGNDRLAAFHRRLGYTEEWETDAGVFMRADRAAVATIRDRLALRRT